MKTFKEWLNEASRWKNSKWKRPPVDALLRLKKYNRDGYYCHFSEIPDKLGINPQTKHEDTPYGIYAYTVKYVLSNGIRNLPYAGNYSYVWVFRARNPKKIKKIKSVSESQAKTSSVVWGSKRYVNENGQLWMKATSETESDFAMTKWFLDRGIEGFVDEGTATIHPSEPFQAVFFGSHTVIPVDVFSNVRIQPKDEPNDEINNYDQEEDDDEYGYDLDYLDDSEFYPKGEKEQTAYGKSPWEKKKKKKY
jgi:hypothetical protein